jgi:hypothetical protein
MATLQADHIEDAGIVGRRQELAGFGRGHPEGPFAIDGLARADRGVDHLAMERRFDGDDHQIDVGVCGHPARIRKGVRRSEVPRCRLRRLGARRAKRGQLIVRKMSESWDMRARSPTLRGIDAGADETHSYRPMGHV